MRGYTHLSATQTLSLTLSLDFLDCETLQYVTVFNQKYNTCIILTDSYCSANQPCLKYLESVSPAHHSLCAVFSTSGSDQVVQCSFSLADSDSIACTLKRLITVLQGKTFVYDIQTPKQDACFSLLYTRHTTSHTSQDMSPIKSEGNSPTFYTESCTVEQAQSQKPSQSSGDVSL